MTQHPNPPATAIVCGADVAGLAAAIDLAQAGWRITLLEQHPATGNSTAPDPANNPHKILRACTSLLNLYERLGVADQLTWSDTLHFADANNPQTLHELVGDDLPAPMHLLRPLMKFTLFPIRQRFTLTRGMLAILQAGSTRRACQQHNDRTFADWLADHGQSADLIAHFWSPLALAACHQTPDRLAAGHALQMFQEGLLADTDAYHHTPALCPHSTLHAPAEKILEHHGGKLRLGTTITALNLDNNRATGVTLDTGETLTADAVIIATPFDQLAAILPEDLAQTDPRFSTQAGTRPATAGNTPNLFLAGDWTDTDWPDTPEGAARAGFTASAAAQGMNQRQHKRAGTLLYRVLAG